MTSALPTEGHNVSFWGEICLCQWCNCAFCCLMPPRPEMTLSRCLPTERVTSLCCVSRTAENEKIKTGLTTLRGSGQGNRELGEISGTQSPPMWCQIPWCGSWGCQEVNQRMEVSRESTHSSPRLLFLIIHWLLMIRNYYYFFLNFQKLGSIDMKIILCSISKPKEPGHFFPLCLP